MSRSGDGQSFFDFDKSFRKIVVGIMAVTLIIFIPIFISVKRHADARRAARQYAYSHEAVDVGGMFPVGSAYSLQIEIERRFLGTGELEDGKVVGTVVAYFPDSFGDKRMSDLRDAVGQRLADACRWEITSLTLEPTVSKPSNGVIYAPGGGGKVDEGDWKTFHLTLTRK